MMYHSVCPYCTPFCQLITEWFTVWMPFFFFIIYFQLDWHESKSKLTCNILMPFLYFLNIQMDWHELKTMWTYNIEIKEDTNLHPKH